MSNAHPDPSPAAGSDSGPLLASLHQGHVRFVVVPAAARARSGDPASAAEAANPILGITPEPSASNLQLLAAALSAGLDARLRTADAPRGLPLRVSAGLFRAIPILPLTTSLGPLNVLSQPPATYHDLLADTTPTGTAEVATSEPPLGAPPTGITSVISDNLPPLPLAPESAAMAATLRNGLDHNALREGDLEELILSALAEDDTPMSIREILLLAPSEKKAPYKRVKTAAETLARRGHLLRDKSGTAHRYRLHTDTDSDDEVARRIHALLADRADPQAILQAALAMSPSTEEK